MTSGLVNVHLIDSLFIAISYAIIIGAYSHEFTKKSNNLLGLQDGKTELLGITGIEVGEYEEISLVIEGEPSELVTYVEDVNGDIHGMLQETVTLDKRYDFEIVKDRKSVV